MPAPACAATRLHPRDYKVPGGEEATPLTEGGFLSLCRMCYICTCTGQDHPFPLNGVKEVGEARKLLPSVFECPQWCQGVDSSR